MESLAMTYDSVWYRDLRVSFQTPSNL